MLKAGGRKEARNRKSKQMINNNKVNNHNHTMITMQKVNNQTR